MSGSGGPGTWGSGTDAPTLWTEGASYTLTLGGRFAGVQDWVIRPEGGLLSVRVQSDFSGALPAGRQVQESRIDPVSFSSLSYSETDGSGRRPQYETVFDHGRGLITLRQGRDEATKPLLCDHQDPLSLLLWLRFPELARAGEARLVGGVVHVQERPDSGAEGPATRTYFLRPGGALVTVEREPGEREPGAPATPRRLLSAVQPSDLGPVLATLDRAHTAQRGGAQARTPDDGGSGQMLPRGPGRGPQRRRGR